MFETKNVIFIHLPKTAGSFVHKFIEDQCKRKPEIIRESFIDHGHGNKHSTINKDDKNKIKKHVLGIIRNPFDHYVSWYTWSFRSGNIFAVNKNKLFSDWEDLRNKFKDPLDVNGFREWLKLVLTKHFINTPFPSNYHRRMSPISYIDLDIGHSTWLFLKMYYWLDTSYLNDSKLNFLADSYLKTETLYEDLIKHYRIEKEEFDKFQRINKTKRHQDYRVYYDDELVELVYHKDRYLFDKFNYVF